MFAYRLYNQGIAHTAIYCPVPLTLEQQNYIAQKAAEIRGNALNWSDRFQVPGKGNADVFSYK